MLRKPDFFLVGAAKSGTTSLYRYLAQHPQVYLPDVKEPHYFGEHRPPWSRLLHGLDEYLALFAQAPKGTRIGEASTSYLYSVRAAGAIREFQPAAKIIIALRNPIGRAYSLYWHQVKSEVEPLTFEEALDAEQDRISRGFPYGYHYVESGKYYPQVARYFAAFGRDSVKIVWFENLSTDPAAVTRELCNFLGVDSDVPLNVGRTYNQSGPLKYPWLRHIAPRNVRSVLRTGLRSLSPRLAEKTEGWNVKRPPNMSASTRARLRDVFEKDITSLGALLGEDLQKWIEE